jgi:hypothetical protein
MVILLSYTVGLEGLGKLCWKPLFRMILPDPVCMVCVLWWRQLTPCEGSATQTAEAWMDAFPESHTGSCH